MDFINDFKRRYSGFDTSGKLIVVLLISSLSIWLIGKISVPAYNYLVYPSGWKQPLFQPWSAITYAFIHSSILHFVGNAIGLYYGGRYFLNLFKSRHFIALFILGVLAGALSFTLGTSIAPYFFNKGGIVGASAGVYAILFFIFHYFAEQDIRVLSFTFKLKYIGYALLAIELIGVTSGYNRGGSLAHLAGAAVGLYASAKAKQGNMIMEPIAVVIDTIKGWFDRSSSKPNSSKMKTVYRSKNKVKNSQKPNQSEIDAILDKIKESGYDSLSKKEKDVLFRASQD
ncbi:rhomboid family protein [Nonlabens tegetincola]|uniref:Rhomboid family protein n=1 Tax=Nonlabens tegetincola TaxID=323273 RepID=A0A090Q2Y8_9FLAO|nr:rhomboid family intramembrane serine protease [Nonlabens tegetincola]MEE2800870.1 rhomboid family intramembrane serine protease [Bacteroidota bacterium]GAK97385.1 rhomboid family protein [Nonlabens tegetincola]